MVNFNHVTTFDMRLVSGDDGDEEKVNVRIGLEGLKLYEAKNTSICIRSLELGHISRLAELLQSKETETAQQTASNLSALVAGGGKKKNVSKLPSADEIEYWKSPDKAGWLQSQGELLKAWRKRWFVLKQGYLFRFIGSTVTEATKPRGVVDLSKIQDVKIGSSITGKPNSIQLKTSSGSSVCYITENETEMVEWMSALEGEVQRVAEDADSKPKSTTAKLSNASRTKAAAASQEKLSTEWMKQQLERTLEGFEGNRTSTGSAAASAADGWGRGMPIPSGQPRGDGGTMVSVVGYEDKRGGHAPAEYGVGMNGLDYREIAGASLVGAPAASNDTDLNYGVGSGGVYGRGLAPSAHYNLTSQSANSLLSSSSNVGYAGGYAGTTFQGSQSGYVSAVPAEYGKPYQQQQYGNKAGPAAVGMPTILQHVTASVSVIDQEPHAAPLYPTYFEHHYQPQASAPPSEVSQRSQQLSSLHNVSLEQLHMNMISYKIELSSDQECV
ncbi:hypothetical protein CEUSTIGMA_g6647.t1 [Chlamydomonas eustigma]|uniref:PH domain-containing protein n=1 Tax=Chlamydomonas eustigma TaxID=1157962 RepID=A0A250X820_9CHLO|nr:hypothetical protein CEUSTIGMA_g6647.t1 [Chlamydomonas eustigma]|eukprot:GAX79207.1 hypothetical protein CEUSTIGMA_g6647.t1 [Chlamydomonas eustigma]